MLTQGRAGFLEQRKGGEVQSELGVAPLLGRRVGRGKALESVHCGLGGGTSPYGEASRDAFMGAAIERKQ